VASDCRLTNGEIGFDFITAVRARPEREFTALSITDDTDPKFVRSLT